MITPANVGGNKEIPVSKAVYPIILCANTGYTKTEVNKPKPATKVNMVVKAKFLFFNTLKLTAGCLIFNSYNINDTSPMTAMPEQ